MLTMVNGEHQASPTTAAAAGGVDGGAFHHTHAHHHHPYVTSTASASSSTAAAAPSLSAMNDENAEPRQRNLPVQVLGKHERYTAVAPGSASAAASAHGGALSGDESSSSMQSANAAHDAQRPREKRSTKSKCPPGLRSGKWTPEEEAFTNMIIYYFKLGRLNVEDGTSLRWYLAKRLNCEAMRVTKKLKGNSSIGKQIFRALEDTEENRRAIEAAAQELAVVEKAFTDSLAATGQPAPNSASTAAAQAAAASRGKRASPHKPAGLPKPPHLEARKLVVPKVRDSLANSEDAKLLLHFFVGAHDATSLDDQVVPTANVEKKRLFSEVDTSPSTASSQGGSPDTKRRSMKMEDLVRTV